MQRKTTTDKRADSVNEKCPENLACCHKRPYLNACAAHDSFPSRKSICLIHLGAKVGYIYTKKKNFEI